MLEYPVCIPTLERGNKWKNPSSPARCRMAQACPATIIYLFFGITEKSLNQTNKKGIPKDAFLSS